MKTISMWRIWVVVPVILAGLVCGMPVYADEIDLQGTGAPVGPVVEGMPLTQVLALFSDPDDPTATASSFTAVINWGDNTTSTGTITTTPTPGVFTVSGTHTYGDELTGNTATITISSNGEPGSVMVFDSFDVVEAETLTGTTFTATAGTQFSGVVASFTDVNPFATPGDFTALVTWGDGTSDFETISSGGGGLFNISGAHTYAGPGPFTVTSTLLLDGFGDDSVTSMANVAGSTSVPEPSSAVLFCGSLGLLMLMTRRRCGSSR